MEMTIKRKSHNDLVLQCTGGGPGTMRLKRSIPITSYCTPGSSHGGKASKGDKALAAKEIVVGPEYDKKNLASLHGGSAGEVTFVHFLFFMKGKKQLTFES